jgi:hypothetical protein
MRRIAQLIALTALAVAVIAGTGCERTVTVNETVTEPANCFDCHSDQSTFLVSAERQWVNSIHASGHNIDRNRTFFGSRCQVCHTSEGFVAKVTGAPIPDLIPSPTVIHCFTCHAPHTNGDLRLRVTAPQTIQDGTSYDIGAGNICASCHYARRNVNTYVSAPNDSIELSEHWGPHHSPQSDMLFGSNGYEFATYPSYRDFTVHRNTPQFDGSNDGCLKCHFKYTSNNVVGGHSFNMEYDLEGEEILNLGGCNDEACHDGALVDFNYKTVHDSVETMLTTLHGLLEAANLVDATGHPYDDRWTTVDSAGAVWNFLIVEEDRSHGPHNPWYIVDLLDSAIQFMQGTLPSPAPVARQRAGDDVPGASR